MVDEPGLSHLPEDGFCERVEPSRSFSLAPNEDVGACTIEKLDDTIV
jgi:hypothetical protein